MCRGCPNVRTHKFGWHELQKAALDRHARDSIDIVTGPETMRVARDAGINPPATASTGLNLHIRKGLSEALKQRISPQCLFTIAGMIARMGQIAVMIPFEIGNWQRFKQLRNLAIQIIADFFLPHIEHQLVARRQQRPAGYLQNPVRMRTKQVAIRIDHFRFDPQTEFHAEACHMRCKRCQAIRIFLLVGPPIAQ